MLVCIFPIETQTQHTHTHTHEGTEFVYSFVVVVVNEKGIIKTKNNIKNSIIYRKSMIIFF